MPVLNELCRPLLGGFLYSLPLTPCSSYAVHDLQRRILEVAEFPLRKDKLVLSKPGPFEMPGQM